MIQLTKNEDPKQNSAPVLSNESKVQSEQTILKVRVASEGFAHGPVYTLDSEETFRSLHEFKITRSISRQEFLQVIQKVKEELVTLQNDVIEQLSEEATSIFAAHLLLLDDIQFTGIMSELIDKGKNPIDAVISVASKYIDLLLKGPSYLAEKVHDIEDLAVRIVRSLVADEQDVCLCKNHIVISKELFLSELLKLSAEGVSGIVLVAGGTTSHMSILARSLNIPLVICDHPELMELSNKTVILLDAETGNLYINPNAITIATFYERNEARQRIGEIEIQDTNETFTSDNTRVYLKASVNLLSDLKLAIKVGVDGIGLYRSEIPFLIRNDFPDEETQYNVYKALFEKLPHKPITLRTLDIGGDKILAYTDVQQEKNPFLGMRSIRYSLFRQDLFKIQLRAMLRAGFNAKLRLCFPMISGVEEFIEAKKIVTMVCQELAQEKIPFNDNPEIGIMVEVPSAVLGARELAYEADFFSVGTNDLIQYTLAIDRTNENVASRYIPFHPSIIRSLKMIADAANEASIPVSICGDMAHQETFTKFFLGLGIRELTIESSYLPRLKNSIRSVSISDAENFAKLVCQATTIQDICTILGIDQSSRIK